VEEFFKSSAAQLDPQGLLKVQSEFAIGTCIGHWTRPRLHPDVPLPMRVGLHAATYHQPWRPQARACRSLHLSSATDTAGCGLQEMADTEQLGSRGEVWLVAQLVLLGLLVFPPGPLEVGTVNRPLAAPMRHHLVAVLSMLPRHFR
jgi:hypothetical protein